MIHLTLRNGDRVQIPAVDVLDVERIAGGSVVYRVSGEEMNVVQDVRTIELRVKVALVPKPELEPKVEPEPLSAVEPPAPPPSDETVRRFSLSERAKRMLRTRSSLSALILGRQQ